MKHKIWLSCGALLLVLMGFGTMGLQAQRQALAPPARTVEYRFIPAAEIGIDLDDLLQRLDYEKNTQLLNQYAADGWRVSHFEVFGQPALLLEREVLPNSP